MVTYSANLNISRNLEKRGMGNDAGMDDVLEGKIKDIAA
jgi:hypothetical protein